MSTRERRGVARRQAAGFGDVLSRRRLRELGIDARMVMREVRAERWRLWGRQTVAMHTGPLGQEALWWRAIWEVGENIAELDGVSALHAEGMVGYVDEGVHVSVLHRHDIEPVPGVHIHKVIRRMPGEAAPAGVPRARPEVAAIRAAHWAKTDRQAALLLCLPVQQRLVVGSTLVAARKVVRGRTRRALIDLVVRDVADGAQSLGELDFAGACRGRGLPEPDRQVLRAGPRGNSYLDVRWDVGLVVEIDGAGHQWGLAVSDDNLRSNAVALGDDTVLHIDLIGWRLDHERYLDQVCEGYERCARRASTLLAS